MPGYRSPNTPVDRTRQGSPFYNPQGPGSEFIGGSTPQTGRGGGTPEWLQYLLGLDTNQLNRDLGFGRLGLDEKLGMGELDLGGRKLGIDEELGRGNLDYLNKGVDVQERLGEGNINKDMALGFGKLGVDQQLGQGRLGTDQYLGQLQAGSANFGNVLDLLGVMENAGASRYGADRGLEGVQERGLADQLVEMLRGESSRDVAGIQNQPALLAEENKMNRFGSVSPLIGMLGSILGQQFGVPVPEFNAPAPLSQQTTNQPPPPPLTREDAFRLAQEADQKFQRQRQPVPMQPAPNAPRKGGPPTPHGGLGMPPIRNTQLPEQNPMLAMLGQMGSMPPAPQMPAMQFPQMPQVVPPKPAPQQEAPAFGVPPAQDGRVSIGANRPGRGAMLRGPYQAY